MSKELAAAIQAHQSGRAAEAVGLYQAVLAADPGIPEAALNLANLFAQAGRWIDAYDVLRRFLDRQPNHPAALFNLGAVLLNMGNAPGAEASFEAVLRQQPDNEAARRNLAVCRDVIRNQTRITPLPEDLNEDKRQRLIWYELAQKFLQVNRVDGVYAEFGCHEVTTFRFALNTLGRYGMPNRIHHFYAFDSFEGMPEPEGIDRQKIWRKGMNNTGLAQFYDTCRLDLHRVTAVKGFFNETLPAYPWKVDHAVALAYIDVDYYSSTVDVLGFLNGKLRHGSIVAFDDWNCYYADPKRGQRLAFAEWQDSLKDTVHFEPFRTISWGGNSFVYLERDKIGQAVQ